jgi:hypothetical protein
MAKRKRVKNLGAIKRTMGTPTRYGKAKRAHAARGDTLSVSYDKFTNKNYGSIRRKKR